MAATQIKLKITFADGTVHEIVAGPRACVELERHYKMSLEEAKRIEHVFFLAWTAMRLSGKETREFEDFLDAVVDVDQVEEVPANPTRESPTSDPSSD